jgi:hypothetical protein
MKRALATHRDNPSRLRGLTALVCGTWAPASMEVYFLGLEQRWRIKNKV